MDMVSALWRGESKSKIWYQMNAHGLYHLSYRLYYRHLRVRVEYTVQRYVTCTHDRIDSCVAENHGVRP